QVGARRGHGGGGRGVAMRPAGGLPGRMVERVTGIEPASRAWKARALPLSYTRVMVWGEGIRRGSVRDWEARGRAGRVVAVGAVRGGLVGAGPWARMLHAPMLAGGPETTLAGIW